MPRPKATKKPKRKTRRERREEEGAVTPPREPPLLSRVLGNATHLWTDIAMSNISGQSSLPPSEREQTGAMRRTVDGHIAGCRAVMPESRYGRHDSANYAYNKPRGPRPMRNCSPNAGLPEESPEGVTVDNKDDLYMDINMEGVGWKKRVRIWFLYDEGEERDEAKENEWVDEAVLGENAWLDMASEFGSMDLGDNWGKKKRPKNERGEELDERIPDGRTTWRDYMCIRMGSISTCQRETRHGLSWVDTDRWSWPSEDENDDDEEQGAVGGAEKGAADGAEEDDWDDWD